MLLPGSESDAQSDFLDPGCVYFTTARKTLAYVQAFSTNQPVCWRAEISRRATRLLVLFEKMEALTMARTQMVAGRAARLRFGFLLLAGFLASASVVSAQYPSKSQVSKDGTAVFLEDYGNPPPSNMTHGMARPPAIDFQC